MRVADEIMARYQHLVSELTLVPGGGGQFEVIVDGENVYSKHRTGRQANDGEVVAALEQILPAGTPRFGT